MFRFERLQVWHKAIALYDLIDSIAQELPAYLRFSLADQLRRAALSDSSNIAEGTGRETEKDTHHFFTLAKSSVFELVSILVVCFRRQLIAGEKFSTAYAMAEEISRMLSALKRGTRNHSTLDSRL